MCACVSGCGLGDVNRRVEVGDDKISRSHAELHGFALRRIVFFLFMSGSIFQTS